MTINLEILNKEKLTAAELKVQQELPRMLRKKMLADKYQMQD